MAEAVEEELPEDLGLHGLLRFRESVIDEYRKRLPILGQFSADQYARTEGTMGDVFIPPGRKGLPFTKLTRKHVRPLLRVAWIAEIQDAATERRFPSLRSLLEEFYWVMAQQDGWASEQYLRTGVAGLTPPKETGFWKRLFRRRR